MNVWADEYKPKNGKRPGRAMTSRSGHTDKGDSSFVEIAKKVG